MLLESLSGFYSDCSFFSVLPLEDACVNYSSALCVSCQFDSFEGPQQENLNP